MENQNDKSAYIPLLDVESEHCALIVDEGLDKVEGLNEHQVELNNKRVLVGSDDLQTALPKAVQQIRDLGYGVPTVKKSFPVLNMSCASCAGSSQSVLEMQLGVVSASVNYANERATIEYIPTLTDPVKLQAALREVGYDLLIDESDRAQQSLEDLQQAHYLQLRNRTIGAISLSVPLVIISMVPKLMHLPYANWIMWILATPVVLFFGRQFFIGAYKQTKNRSANMDTLVAISTGVAYLFSSFNTFFPDFWHSRGLHAHVYFEAAAVVIAFILLGKLLEEKAKGNTSGAIKKLMGLQPKSVTVIREDDRHEDIPIAEIEVGDLILVKPGEKIAVDGRVSDGDSYVDESTISGEAIPVHKVKNEAVYSGTVNQKGSFRMIAEKIGKDTLLAQIIKTVQDAQGSKAPVQKLVDRIAGVFVPVVIGIAVLSFILWMLLGGEDGFSHGLMAFITVLVIACPCALGLATPTAIMVGIGKAAEKGILIKDAQSLELAKATSVVMLDKTGTITEGKPSVVDVLWLETETAELRDILFSIEKSSTHPLAEAISGSLETEARFLKDLSIETVIGKGIIGNYQNKKYGVGKSDLMGGQPASLNEKALQWIREKEKLAHTVVYFFTPGTVLAAFAIADKIKPESVEAIKKLHAMGIEVHMLTGDSEASANAVASQTGITRVKAGLLPQDKAAYINTLQHQGKVVAMVGDGINDSTALAQADVSIAMGKGSDIAMDVAKMTIISNDLNKIVQAISLSKHTTRTIRENLFWAFIYNLIGIPIAAGILFPFNGYTLNPMIAGAAMALSSISVVGNSLRLKWKN
ncbi:MAG TPA: heavy metal translocating P-type ATPase [Saprospiraceae bacterium]|nr:heavy metal translocating P-type ATPase [Saprospiraceae bacterium]